MYYNNTWILPQLQNTVAHVIMSSNLIYYSINQDTNLSINLNNKNVTCSFHPDKNNSVESIMPPSNKSNYTDN